MSQYIDEMVAARKRVGQQIAPLLEIQSHRSLDREEAGQFADLTSRFDRIDTEIKRAAETDRYVGRAGNDLAAKLETSRDDRRGDEFGIDIRDLVGQAFRGSYRGFDSAISSGMFESRALQSAGGSAIETSFADQVIAYQRTLSPMLDPNIVRTISRTDGSPYIQPRLTADAAAGGTVTAEAGGITLLDPTVSAVTITPTKRAAITKISSELWEDNDIDLDSLVVETTARAIGIALGTATTATLVAGIANGGTAAGTALGAASWTFFGPPDLATLYTSVAAPYRTFGTWLVSNDAYAKLFQLRDSQQQPVLFYMAATGTPLLFGRPVVVDPGLASVGSASKSVLFGDFRQALTMVRRSPLDVLVSREPYYSTDEVGVRVIDRSAGAVIDAVSAAYLVSANT